MLVDLHGCGHDFKPLHYSKSGWFQKFAWCLATIETLFEFECGCGNQNQSTSNVQSLETITVATTQMCDEVIN